jgi:hypothetical protein
MQTFLVLLPWLTIYPVGRQNGLSQKLSSTCAGALEISCSLINHSTDRRQRQIDVDSIVQYNLLGVKTL